MSSSDVRRPRYTSIKSQSQGSENGWARPPSPTYSTTTTGSRVNLPPNHMLITRKDLRQSIACFEELMAAAKAYRNALLAMSQATAAFAQAMEACSRIKGCRSSNSALAGASGLQHLLANNDQLLADTVYRQFEIPLLSALDHYKLITADRLARYEQALSEQSARIRKTESENLRGGRRRKRDLDSFRVALQELQRQVDELDNVKAGYHEEVLEGEDEIWDTVLTKVAFVVRSQLDFCEKIAGKASDTILEPLVSSIPDPFDTYGPPKEEGQIFSVLSPLGLLDTIPQSPTPGFTRSRQPTSGTTGISPSHTSSISPSSGSTSPTKTIFPGLTPLPLLVPTPSIAETTTVSALGIRVPDEENQGGRARRELSVIEEREAGLVREEVGADENGIEEEGENDQEILPNASEDESSLSELSSSAADGVVSNTTASDGGAGTTVLPSIADHAGSTDIPPLPTKTPTAPSSGDDEKPAQSAREHPVVEESLLEVELMDTEGEASLDSAAQGRVLHE